MMSGTDALRALLRDITPVNEHTQKPPPEETAVIDYFRNPLNPLLLSYCFDNVLGFDVQYRLFAKINYIIAFDYKGAYGCVAHRKMSFDLRIHRDYEDELIALFQEARALLSEHFLQCGKEALAGNRFSMENDVPRFREKLAFFADKIEYLAELRGSLENEQVERVSAAQEAGEEWTEVFNLYQKLQHRRCLEERYAIETYIDVSFSCLEHIATLLFPFTESFDPTKSYSAHYIHNPRWTWEKKLLDVGCGAPKIQELADRLREIKEVYRNRAAHGMFSRELKAYAQIDDFGRYPMYLGKNYLQGFVDDYELSLDYPKYHEIKAVFDELLEVLRTLHPVPMVFIDFGVEIPVMVSDLTKGVSSKEEAAYLAQRYLYNLDNQANMDW